MTATQNGPDQRRDFDMSLQRERERLREAIDGLDKEIEVKERERRIMEARLGHVEALLSLEAPSDGEPARRRARGKPGATPTAELLDMAETVLRERQAEPMHYRDLAEELQRRGAVIRGKDAAASLVARMIQDDNRRDEAEKRFVRPASKGFYALRTDFPDSRNVGSRRKRELAILAEGN